VTNASVPSGDGAPAAVAAPIAGEAQLRHGALGLLNAIVISVAVMSPAASIFFNSYLLANNQVVGAAMPLAFLLGFVVVLLVANQYSEFSRELPSSGSSYTFVSEGLGPQWGFLTGWVGLIAIAIGVPYSFVFMSANVQTLVQTWFGVSVSWIVFYVAATGIVFTIAFIGVRQSLRVDLTFLIFEVGICLALAVIILLRLGSAGKLSATPFTLGALPLSGDLAVGMVLAVLNFICFETASTLGEETRNPHRSIPRAVYGSLLTIGIFYIIMAYASTVGGLPGIVNANTNDHAPFHDLALRFGGSTLALLIDIVGVVGFMSAALAIVNGGARILYSVARDGLLPRPLAWIHPVRHTPGGSIAFLCGIGLISGIPLSLVLGAQSAFLLLATLDAVFILFIYTLTNVAAIRFFRTQRRDQFSLLRHGVIPGIGTLITFAIFALVMLPQQGNPAVLNAVPVVVGLWLVVGVVLILILRKHFAKT
jgi:amino acid transporter